VRARRIALLPLVWVAACGDDRPTPPLREQPQRRVIEPPSTTVRPLPPYAIVADGVGPYKLKQNIAALMDRLPKGPRMARFEIPGLLHVGVVRAEDDTVLIGTEVSAAGGTSTTSFIAVIGRQVASMDSGLHVGSTWDEVKKLNPVNDDLDRARDPRLVMLATARNSRLVIDSQKKGSAPASGDRVVAIVLSTDTTSREPVRDDCQRPASTDTAVGACLTTSGELIEVDGDELVVRSASSEKTLTRFSISNLVFAVPLRSPIDGRDEVIAISRNVEPNQRTWTIAGFRVEGTQLKPSVMPTPIYQLTSAQTRWIGAELREIDLYLELANRGDGIEVGGLLTTRSNDRIRDVVVISPVTVTRRHHKPATSDPEPTAPDAGVTVGSGDRRGPPKDP
jgi:hypothetical protein